jgi:hypothetical protein
MKFRDLLEARKGKDAIYGIRKMRLDIDALFDNPKTYKDVESVIDDAIKELENDKYQEMKDGMSDKDYEKYMNFLYDIQEDPKGALEALKESAPQM